MNPAEWTAIISALSDASIDVRVHAAERLHAESRIDDVPNLLRLLESDDFFIREAAAWPLANLVGPEVLPQLLVAYQRGFEEGHDNDGFTAALLEIPSLHPTAVRSSIERVASISQDPIRGHAVWLLGFCKSAIAADARDA